MATETLQLSGGRRRRSWRLGDAILALAIGWLLLVAIASLGADILAPFDPNATNLGARLKPPVWAGGDGAHPLGTDHLGRDMLSRLMHAMQMSLFIAFVGTCVGAVLGSTIGFTAAHFGGLVDDALMVLVDFQAAMPFLIIAIGAMAFFGSSMTVLLILMGLYGWERYARLARGLALSAARDGYAEAALAFGASPIAVYRRHILPNIAGALLVNVTLNFPETVMLESTLSFLGLGVQPPTASLGSMLSYGRDYLINAWWIAVFSGLLIFFTTLSMSLLGDAMRDRLSAPG